MMTSPGVRQQAVKSTWRRLDWQGVEEWWIEQGRNAARRIVERCCQHLLQHAVCGSAFPEKCRVRAIEQSTPRRVSRIAALTPCDNGRLGGLVERRVR